MPAYFACFVFNHHLQFVPFYHRECHLYVHQVTFSLNSGGVKFAEQQNISLLALTYPCAMVK